MLRFSVVFLLVAGIYNPCSNLYGNESLDRRPGRGLNPACDGTGACVGNEQRGCSQGFGRRRGLSTHRGRGLRVGEEGAGPNGIGKGLGPCDGTGACKGNERKHEGPGEGRRFNSLRNSN